MAAESLPRRDDFPLTLDIGGEGKHPAAWNLNPSPVRTGGPWRGEPIPRHLAGRADAIPLPDGCVAQVIVERTPLLGGAWAEIRRVLQPGGSVTLRHACPPGIDPHATAIAAWGKPRTQRRFLHGAVELQESVFVPKA